MNKPMTYEVWESCKKYSVKAESLWEAITIALMKFFSEENEHYIEDSFLVDEDITFWYPDEKYDLNSIINNL
jgi:hypothetical protein